MNNDITPSIRTPFGFDDLLDNEISLCVQPLSHGGFGVYANAHLIAIHPDEGAADAHLQWMRIQQSAP
jgi:hypothetical protein